MATTAPTPTSVDVVVREVDQVGVVSLRGTADDSGQMVRIAHELIDLRVDGGHVVLDLVDLAIGDPAALCAFFARLSAASTGGVPIPAVVPDPGMRRLLRACGSGGAGLALFGSVEDACLVVRPAYALASRS